MKVQVVIKNLKENYYLETIQPKICFVFSQPIFGKRPNTKYSAKEPNRPNVE
ncbi:unnamed protein product [Larinioides sclopetarius]|uniref:Ribosomal protein L32 n=1 Tax=Larinioides sclopetarius TaxID=280406 RepID=A0AAV2ALV5_9ARAC